MRAATAIVLLSQLLSSSAALAHANLVESNPAAGAVIAAPRTIRLSFSEKIAREGSGFQLSMGDGMSVSTAMESVSSDGKTLSARTISPFMSGKWTLSWHALSADDGHKTEGSYSFTVK